MVAKTYFVSFVHKVKNVNEFDNIEINFNDTEAITAISNIRAIEDYLLKKEFINPKVISFLYLRDAEIVPKKKVTKK